MTNSKKLIAIFIVLAMVIACVFALTACKQHECTSKCATCEKCTNLDCKEASCEAKCQGHKSEQPHECTSKCTTCGKCTNSSCKENACKEKCTGHEQPQPTKLATPVLALNENVVSWTAIVHADNYSVSVNDGKAQTTTATNYTVTETVPGAYVVKVVANSNNADKYLPSEAATITYTVDEPEGMVVTALSEYVVVPYAEGWTIEWTKFDFSEYITAKIGEDPVDYKDLTISATGTTCGEKALTVTVENSAGGGSQEVKFDVYYGIADVDQFRAIADDLAGWYILTQDIEFGVWIDPMAEFTGHLNGNYKKMINYKVGGEGWDHAMFNVNRGTIEALNIQGGQSYGAGRVAMIAGHNYGTIANCYVQVNLIGGSTNTAGITAGAGEDEATAGTVIGCIVIADVFAEDNTRTAGIVDYAPAGTIKDNLFIGVTCDTAHNHATEAVRVPAEATVANNAAIGADKLTFAEDNKTFWSSDDTATVYENNFSDEVLDLVKEYLRQLDAE